jgi:hypothetical protein
MHQAKQTVHTKQYNQPNPPNQSKLNIKQMLNVADSRSVPVALAMQNALRAPIFVPSKPDIYQSGTVQFNMQYF